MEKIADSASTFKVVKAIYILNFVGVFFPFCAIVGVILAYVFKDDAHDYLKSHFQYQIRSFWIYILYLVISGILCFVVVGFILLFITAVWWVIRNARGLKSALAGREMSNAQTWGF